MVNVITGDLGPTATYQRRSFAWVSNGSGFVSHERTLADGEQIEEVVPALGKLTIKVQHAKGCGCQCEIDTYAVEEVAPEQIGTRLFVLLNLSDPSQREPYRVTVGGMNRCRCQAGVCKVPSCKHRDACAALVAEGAFEPSEELTSV